MGRTGANRDIPKNRRFAGSLTDFMTYCHITETPFIERDLFT